LKRCKELKVLSQPGDVVRIHNERTKFWTFTVPRQRTVDLNITQSIHPFAIYLDNKPVSYKGAARSTPYRLRPELTHPTIEVAPEFLTRNFKSNSGGP